MYDYRNDNVLMLAIFMISFWAFYGTSIIFLRKQCESFYFLYDKAIMTPKVARDPCMISVDALLP